eukprot:scaffold1888_cov120-Cylindrotheca_fusiformis.AAC.19
MQFPGFEDAAALPRWSLKRYKEGISFGGHHCGIDVRDGPTAAVVRSGAETFLDPGKDTVVEYTLYDVDACIITNSGISHPFALLVLEGVLKWQTVKANKTDLKIHRGDMPLKENCHHSHKLETRQTRRLPVLLF